MTSKIDAMIARIDVMADAVKKDGQESLAEQLRSKKNQPVDSGTELALIWRKCLLQILRVPCLSESTRTMGAELVRTLDDGLGYSRLPKSEYPDDQNRSPNHNRLRDSGGE